MAYWVLWANVALSQCTWWHSKLFRVHCGQWFNRELDWATNFTIFCLFGCIRCICHENFDSAYLTQQFYSSIALAFDSLSLYVLVCGIIHVAFGYSSQALNSIKIVHKTCWQWTPGTFHTNIVKPRWQPANPIVFHFFFKKEFKVGQANFFTSILMIEPFFLQ